MCPFKELTFYLYVIHNSRRRTAATWRNELLLQLINVTVKGLTLILLPPGGLKNINSLCCQSMTHLYTSFIYMSDVHLQTAHVDVYI